MATRSRPRSWPGERMPRDDGEWHVLVPVDWSRDPVIFIFENKIRFPDAYKERKEGGAVVLPHPRVYTIDS